MSIISEKDRQSIIEALVELTSEIFRNYAADTAEQVEAACDYANHMVHSGQWTPEKAQLHVKIQVGSAAAYNANKTSMQYNYVRSTIWKILGILAGSINTRVGFQLIPPFQ